MQTSDSIKELATALSLAQGEIENATKNANNPHFRSKYADLAEIINTVRPVLAKHGLAVVQFPGMSDGNATVETILAHKSGEWMRGTAESPLPKADPQGVGSATTYLRRYSLAAVCGIAQEDDDGEGAVSRNGNGRSAKAQTPPEAAKALREFGKHTDPETAAEIEMKIQTGMTIQEARDYHQSLKARFAVGAR